MEENNGQAHMREDGGASMEDETHESKPRRKSFVIIIAIAVAVIAICAGAYFGYFKPLNEARARFEAAAADVQAKNDELDGAIENLNELATDGGEPLDPATADAANAAIADARKAERAVPQEPGSADELNAAAGELFEPLDYSAQLASIETARATLEDSIARRALVEQPTGDHVVARLQTLDGVSDVAAVTEDNDPNGQLNKAGGYTASQQQDLTAQMIAALTDTSA